MAAAISFSIGSFVCPSTNNATGSYPLMGNPVVPLNISAKKIQSDAIPTAVGMNENKQDLKIPAETTNRVLRYKIICEDSYNARPCKWMQTPTGDVLLVTQKQVDMRQLQMLGDSVVKGFEVQTRSTVQNSPSTGVKCATSKRAPRKKQAKPCIKSKGAIEHLLRSIAKISKKGGKPVIFVGARKEGVETRVRNRLGGDNIFVTTRHQKGLFRKVDLFAGSWETHMLSRMYVTLNSSRKEIDLDKVTKGDSGLFYTTYEPTHTGDATVKPFVVRGRIGSYLVNSLERVEGPLLPAIEHYSDVANQFWKGHERGHLAVRPHSTSHECERNANIEECGEVIAKVMFGLAPLWKITCKQCMADVQHRVLKMGKEHIQHNLSLMADRLRIEHPSFPHIASTLEQLTWTDLEVSDHLPVCGEVHKSIADHKSPPFQHLNDLNDMIMKAKFADTASAELAAKSLQQITRWHLNRTEHIKAGSVESFRNKISAKAHINPALMCDNQLDGNGNFIWGLRGYHAKRFFRQYFEVITVGDNYDKYATRKLPNSERQLATMRLIVPLDLEKFRETLVGVVAHDEPTTRKCISLENGDYVHPCCCVTLNDGAPLTSKVMFPTKNHLVIGNTGDSKFVDLPAELENNLYIAKDGFCYVNIFLAMLVNVSEANAKQFTKMARDYFVSKLGQWPTMQDVATACYQLSVFFPEVMNAELPRILVDHKHKTMHVIDSYGSLSVGYHILKANTVKQLTQFAHNSLEGEMKHYRVGGTPVETALLNRLCRCLYREDEMANLLQEEPCILLLSLVSPSVLIALYNSRSLEIGIKMWIHKNMSVAVIISILESLGQKVSRARSLLEQHEVITRDVGQIARIMRECSWRSESHLFILQKLDFLENRRLTDEPLVSAGYVCMDEKLYETMEKIYVSQLATSWNELSLYGKYRAMWHSTGSFTASTTKLRQLEQIDVRNTCNISLGACWESTKNTLVKSTQAMTHRFANGVRSVRQRITRTTVFILSRCIPDLVQLINMLLVVSIILQIAEFLRTLVREHKRLKWIEEDRRRAGNLEKLIKMYDNFVKENGNAPTEKEFIDLVELERPELVEDAVNITGNGVTHQAKAAPNAHFERIIAIVSLVLMVFDCSRSDAVSRSLQKLKFLTSTATDTVHHQSIDDIKDDFTNDNLTVNFQLDSDKVLVGPQTRLTFETWWDEQITSGRVVAHYRTGGHFIEFTRDNAATISVKIAHSIDADEFLIRGAVGSGKSTGLPYYLSTNGHVLLIEPTRPLSENVSKQLKQKPFYQSPTLLMRGVSAFGSSPITVMTSGYALHYLANNPEKLSTYKFVMFDECHVMDASAMAFYSLLKEFKFEGKILKVSATPPGRECEFATQKKVTLAIEEQLTFEQFVNRQGDKSNCDVVKHGINILVYVASYNDVDSLSKLLNEKGYLVTKVDGRTMKVGSVEIETKGTDAKPHFIVATNIIENGVTLDVDVVVDFGMKVEATLDSDCRCVRYQRVSVSYGERIQRLGRVGRFKEGHALRIGPTMTGLAEIPTMVATEAAFYCYCYNLPVMTPNVSTTLLGNCTKKQANTILTFELCPYYMFELVDSEGCMHPQIYNLFKNYRLRESDICLKKTAIPTGFQRRWIKAGEYRRMGVAMEINDDVGVPFSVRGIPDKLHVKLWEVANEFAQDSCLGRLTMDHATKVAYTLQTDIHSLPRTIQIIEKLLEEEMIKHTHYQNLNGEFCSSGSISLSGILGTIKRHYTKDHSGENIKKLKSVHAQLLEFQNLNIDASVPELLQSFGSLKLVHHESCSSVSETLGLEGRWNKELMTRDFIVSASVGVGAAIMLYYWFKGEVESPVHHQGFGKRQRQKLRFRRASDARMGFELDADPKTLEQYFGDAYTKKEKKSGRARNAHGKTRRFVNFYGFDPTEYALVRYVDTLTGITYDDSPMSGVEHMQEYFLEMRKKLQSEDELSAQSMMSNQRIEAYFIKHGAKDMVKVDLTPHNPLLICAKTNNIAKFPEREYEMRQSSKAETVDKAVLPPANYKELVVEHESLSLHKGLRDYNPIARSLCYLTNKSEGSSISFYGVGFGPLIITNRHLFQKNNGELLVRTHHGEFTARNTTQLQVHPVKEHELVLILMPKDFPPFPSKLTFRHPIKGERVSMVGTLFQERSLSSTVSESSVIFPHDGSKFWSHHISTKAGYCGLPLVSSTDGAILGLHSISSNDFTVNYFASVPHNFKEKWLQTQETLDWSKHWLYNPNEIGWGSLRLTERPPSGIFKTDKLVSDLELIPVHEQGVVQQQWVADALHGNLKAVAFCPNKLVVKHVVKGKCALFDLYLRENDLAREYFQPLMGSHGKSGLNRAAFLKDLLKYASPIYVGEVQTQQFDVAVTAMIRLLHKIGFSECSFITDAKAVIDSLNLNAATGTLYSGKKKDFFKDFTDEAYEEIVQKSCLRLFLGDMGLWNGSLKAELRPMEKVLANKTRTFTAAPIETLLGGKVCVDDFNNQFYDLHITGPWTVGMTKFYKGWDRLLNELPEGWIYCDADGSQFDSSLSPYLINAVTTIRLHFMEQWDVGETMLKNLYTEIVYTPIAVPDGTVVKKFKGNNSGQPSTVVDNSLMVCVTMFYALSCAGVDLEHYQECMRFFVNGDDLMIAVKPDMEYLLDGLQASFKELGLNYEFTSRTREKKELWFMSHQGIMRDGVYIPKLEMERIVSILEWDRSAEPEHRLEAICASMIEAWGHDELLHQIRLFYAWVLEMEPYKSLAACGKAPYISELALKKLYLDENFQRSELEQYLQYMTERFLTEPTDTEIEVHHQAGEPTPPTEPTNSENPPPRNPQSTPESLNAGKNNQEKSSTSDPSRAKDKDVNAGTIGLKRVPRLTKMQTKMQMPEVDGMITLDLDHLLTYLPKQVNLHNTRATNEQYKEWYTQVKSAYGVSDDEMRIIMNGFTVWCIENGTSPNINGKWTMMDGNEQVEFDLKPMVEFAKPTLRQIMAHHSEVAETYIVMRNTIEPYMPRYGIQRNLTDRNLAQYAFDFYEVTSRTPARAREAHFQMKAAALRGKQSRLFGLDGNVGSVEEITERHTTDDVNRDMHTMLGVRNA